MTALVTIIHVIICAILIVAVLLQSGKAADLAGAFGGGGSQTAFGPRGTATLLSKVTTICAILFMLTSLGLWILSGHESKSAVSGVEAKPAQTTAPAKTATTPPPATAKPDDKAAAAQQPAEKPAEKPADAKTTPPAPADKKTPAQK